ncbi:MAG: hypothetical protein ACPGR7_05080 [Flavobacteriaceae bacterium]
MKNKFIAFWLVLLMGLPMSMEFHHIVTDEHSWCFQHDDIHLHQKDHDCDHTHFSTNNTYTYTESSIDFSVFESPNFSEQFSYTEKHFSTFNLDLHKRGPPNELLV